MSICEVLKWSSQRTVNASSRVFEKIVAENRQCIFERFSDNRRRKTVNVSLRFFEMIVRSKALNEPFELLR